jgi:selenocysteine-specific elongation factor
VAGQRTAINLQGLERAAVERGDVIGHAGTLSAMTLVDVVLEMLADAPRALKSRDRVRVHTGTSEIMARALLLGGTELAPGQRGFARLRLEAPLVALAGDRFVIRSYSPIVTIGGGTLLDTDPPRLKRPARLAHLEVLESGVPEAVVEEHVRGAGVGGIRLPALVARVPFGPARTRQLLDALAAAGRVTPIDRDWSLHADAVTRLRRLITAALEQFHRTQPLRSGMSREELRVRAANADERVFAHVLGVLDAEGVVRVDRDKVRLASHELRLSPVQQAAVDRLEREFREAAAAPPSPEEALARAGLAGDEQHELFQLLLESRKLVRVKESLFFHAAALDTIQDKLVVLLRERKEIGPGDIKDLLGISRKYAIPLLEYFDARRVTMRVGERRVLRGG